MNFFNSIRAVLIRHLKEETYKKWAERYNDIRVFFRLNFFNNSHNIDCGLPLIYISQPPRCGGTITRNLFDGHPSLHVYPYELCWEKKGYHWEEGLTNSAKNLKLLKGRWLSHAINYGFDKTGTPFYFLQSALKTIFLNQQTQNTRETLDLYFTSFYNAWINYQNLYGNKLYGVAFCPRDTIEETLVGNYFDIYPDGYRIHIIRNPLAWWASEKSYDDKRKIVKNYLTDRWIKSTQAGLLLAKKYPEKYILVNYENLILKTEETLQLLCQKINLPFDKILLNPTINNVDRLSNSSHGEKTKGINQASLEKWRNILAQEEITEIENTAIPLYKSALELCLNRFENTAIKE